VEKAIDLTHLALDSEDRKALEVASRNAVAMLSSLPEVKPYPTVVAKIRRVTADPRATVAQVAEVVESDLAFSTSMLRTVNSAGAGMGNRCSTIKHAVALLGMKRIADLAAATAALDFVQSEAQEARDLFTHSLGAASIARMIAPYIGIGADDAFTAALLHDVGGLILMQAGARTSPNDDDAWAADERSRLGYDHGHLGATVLAMWNLPAPIPEVVLRHHDWRRAVRRGGDLARFAAVVRASDLLARLVVKRREPVEADLEAIKNEPCVALLGVQAEELLRMWPALRDAERDGRSLTEEVPPSTRDFASFDQARRGLSPDAERPSTRWGPLLSLIGWRA
jgi:HD-like signal output (HDOD) protein